MKMKISKKRFKEILAEEIKSFKEASRDIDKMGRNLDKSVKKIGNRKKDLSVKEASGDDYHDDWVDVLGGEDGPYDPEAEADLDDHTAAGQLADKIYDLANEIDEYGQYDTETQTEAYRQLLGAMQMSGVNLERMLMMLTENKK
jgi:hypothetical protein